MKVYLTASSRYGQSADTRSFWKRERSAIWNQEIERDIIERDNRDMSREISPLKQAEDAVLLYFSSTTLKEVLELMELAEDAGARGCCGC